MSHFKINLNFQKFCLLYGFSIWLFATLLVSYFGHFFFLIDNLAIMFSLYVGMVPVLYFLIMAVFKLYKPDTVEKLKGVILLALPGMMLDTFCIIFHKRVFPSFSMEQVIVLCSWILWVYASVLLIGFLSKNYQATDKQPS